MSKKVLIVEDDSTFANAIALAARKVGYSSQICAKPEDALAALEKETFSIRQRNADPSCNSGLRSY